MSDLRLVEFLSNEHYVSTLQKLQRDQEQRSSESSPAASAEQLPQGLAQTLTTRGFTVQYPWASPTLPLNALKDVSEYLGPGCAELRATCPMAKSASEHLDIVENILKWHCVNGTLLRLSPGLNNIESIDHMGRLPLRCVQCNKLVRTRHIYRFNLRPHEDWGFRHLDQCKVYYICGTCVFGCCDFLQRRVGFRQGSCLVTIAKKQMIKDLTGRVRLNGFLGKVFTSNPELWSHI
jgi:hypothetical protein